MSELKKIVVIGPESTGKSTLCALLAAHYSTLWCPEYAREYLLTHGVTYNYDDLLTIAKGQLALEEEYQVKSEKLKVKSGEARETADEKQQAEEQFSIADRRSPINALFIDTDMYVMKVWCEYVYGKCHAFINEQIAARKYDLYLLCDIDLPWEEDVLREYPDMERRQELYSIYKNLLINQQTPWVEISGSYEDRLQEAIAAVDSLFAK